MSERRGIEREGIREEGYRERVSERRGIERECQRLRRPAGYSLREIVREEGRI